MDVIKEEHRCVYFTTDKYCVKLSFLTFTDNILYTERGTVQKPSHYP